MLTLKELNSWFEDLSRIIIDLNIAFNNLKELSITSENESIEKIKRHGFFLHHRFQLTFIIVVQLSKIYSNSRNQKIRIKELLRKLKIDDYDENLLAKLDDNKRIPTIQVDNEILPKVFVNRDQITSQIELFNAKIKGNKKIIKKLEDLRNKIYAHSDPETTRIIPNIQIVEFERLIVLANDFYNTFRGRLFDIHTDFRTGDWSIKYTLNLMALQFNKRNK